MNGGGRARHERGGGVEAERPEAETVTLLICKSYHRIYSSALGLLSATSGNAPLPSSGLSLLAVVLQHVLHR